MYYEIDETQQLSSHKIDESPIIDFDYLQLQDPLPGKQIVINREITKESQWVKKYEPKSFIELLTDDKVNKDLLTWLKTWSDIISGKIQKMEAMRKQQTASIFTPTRINMQKTKDFGQSLKSRNLILLAGPPGCGKTTLIRVLAKHCKFQVEQINASDDRSANLLIEKIENISGNETIRKNKNPTLICLDQVDGAAQSEASGLAKVLEYIEHGKNQIKNNTKNKKGQKNEQSKIEQKDKYHKKQIINLNRPVIFICNDPFVKGLKELRHKAHVIYFQPLATDRVVKRLKQICTKEKVYVENNVLNKICEICSNDIRSCIGILELVVKEKRSTDRNPKQIIEKLKLSFVKDNEATINDFLSGLINRKKNDEFSSDNKIIKIQRDVVEIGNYSLLLEYFYHNILGIKGIFRNPRSLLKLYDDMVYCAVQIKTSFKYRNQLDSFQSVLYMNFYINILSEEYKRIQFPSQFFENLTKNKINIQIFEKIYANIPPRILIFLNKNKIIGYYLLTMFLGMQAQNTKDSEIGKCLLRMLTYGFTFRRDSDRHSFGPIFHPQIDTLLTFKGRKLEYILSNSSKISMQQNYQFYKHKKMLLSDVQLKDSTESMLNQLNLQSRKKRNKNKSQFALQYKFQEGTGTKITEKLIMNDFF